MKFYESTSVFQYPWNQVAQGIWQRYPNPQSSHVLSEDTISRRIEGDKLFSKRILTKTNRLPKWGERFVSARHVSIIEESVVNRETKEICTYTRNIGLNKVMSVIEKVTYRPCESNSNWTEVEKKAWVNSRIYGFSYAIEKFGIDRYKRNIFCTNNGFQYVLDKLFPAPPVEEASFDSSLDQHKLRIKNAARETAKIAKEIAKEKGRQVYVSCENS